MLKILNPLRATKNQRIVVVCIKYDPVLSISKRATGAGSTTSPGRTRAQSQRAHDPRCRTLPIYVRRHSGSSYRRYSHKHSRSWVVAPAESLPANLPHEHSLSTRNGCQHDYSSGQDLLCRQRVVVSLAFRPPDTGGQRWREKRLVHTHTWFEPPSNT